MAIPREKAEEPRRETAAIIPLKQPSLEEQEWSERGRSRLPAGWYIVPAFLLTLILVLLAF